MNTTNGRIAVQSKQRIARALLCVMKQYDFREITVTQIAQEAELSRKTFYRLFSDKHAVLTYFFDGLFTECIATIKAMEIHHYWELVQFYFDFWEEKRTLLALLKENDLLALLFEFSYKHSEEVFTSVRSRETANSFSKELPYLLAYAAGGMHSMLLKWVESDMVIPSSELITTLKAGFMSVDI